MTDGEALLAAILAQPAEDTPRLVYADWLQENGQPERAEFIRVQCKLARTPEPEYKTISSLLPDVATYHHGICVECRRLKTKCRYHVLNMRSFWILRGHALEGMPGENWEKWFTKVLPRIQNDGFTPTGYDRPVRGFIESLRCRADDWIAHADAILAQQPVQKVALTTFPQFEDVTRRWETVDRKNRVFIWATVAGKLIELPPLWEGERQAEPLLEARWPGITFEVAWNENEWWNRIGPIVHQPVGST